ncbi:hypothetical protein AB0L82_17745 [Nocardia sp. NPDC052001]|uniref:hypothetical protein n=1 Tax=Nocardia sp. NPDC052001 TaxID=3154853 RepID=UPI00341A47F9
MDKQRPSAMTLPDILAMTSSGQPGPGKKVTLPSGALWEGGPTAGTSLITLPDSDPILIADNGSGVSNSIVGRSGPFGAMARVFEEVLGHVPSFFANRVAAQALELVRGLPEPDDRETETRIVKFSSKATLLNPAKSRNRSGSSSDDSEAFGIEPIRRANGGYIDESEYRNRASGMVRGPGGPLGDGVPLRASDGEYVVRASAVDNTLPLLEMINSGWVPSARFLAGMLQGFSGPAANPATDAQNWRDMLGQGVIADSIGNIGNAALNTGAWAGAALGSALAPMFQPGGLLAPRQGSGGSTTLPRDSADSQSGLTASMQAAPSGILGMFGGSSASSTAGAGAELSSLAQALSSGIAGAATAAGSTLGSMLGNAIKPALGPGGDLAPQIGEQLGRLIGSQFGGALTASMSVKTEGGQLGSTGGLGGGTSVGGGTSTGGGNDSGAGTSGGDTGGPEPTGDGGGGSTVVGAAGPAGGSGGGGTGGTPDLSARWDYLNGQDANGNPVSGWAYLVPNSDVVGALTSEIPEGMKVGQYLKDDGTGPMVRDVPGTSWIDTLTGKSDPAGAQDLVGTGHRYNPNSGNFGDLLQVVANQAGGNLGELLKPILGENAPEMVRTAAEQFMKPIGDAYNAADPNHEYTNTLGTWLGNTFGIKWTPNGQSGSSSGGQLSHEQQIGVSALEYGISGLQQHGLLGGLTGAISGAASTAGSTIGGVIGTAIAPFLGPAAALGPAIGSLLGSMAGSMISSQITRPIEWAGNAVKELVGTGFGLTDLADGPGGRTMRGDIYNFNGTDPKSASIATERVRRRRAVAQQRGGGMGR